MRKTTMLFYAVFKCHFHYFSEISFSKLVPPTWCHLLGSWIQDAVISGYKKKCMLGVVGRGSGRSQSARMNLLSMYDRVP